MKGNRMKANALAAALIGLLAGCGGGSPVGEGSVPHQGGGPTPPPAPGSANPAGLDFRATVLGAPAAPDGRNWRTAEYLGHWGLDAISAHEAYARGHFGQGVTIAIADDGFDPTHPDLAGRIRAPRHVVNRDANVFEPGYGGQPGEGHGTYVALVAAGASGNAGGPFGIDIEGGRVIPTKNAHGVAPQASVMPIQLSGGGLPAEAIRHAAANGAQVVNLSIGLHRSYYGEFAGRDGVWLTLPLPIFRPLIGSEPGRRHAGTPGILDEFREMAGILGGSDMTVVWAAGNEGWNAVSNGTRMCGKNFIGEDGCPLGEGPVSAVDFMEGFSWLYDEDDPSRKLRFRDMWGECGSGSCADYNSGGAWQSGPLFEPGLLGRWLVVGALDRHGEIAGFSNGCGEARNWCVFAPGADLAVGVNESLHGTSFAAPVASGALAVLRSRLPGMPMDAVQALLLVSADPLGTRLTDPDEPDPVYGWGRLNLGRAVMMQGRVRLPFPTAGTAEPSGTAHGVRLGDAGVSLSPALAHAGERMKAVEVAVGGVGDAYFNMPLPVGGAGAGGPPKLGRAARDLLGPRRLSSGLPGPFAETGPDGMHVRAVGMDVSAGALGRWRLRWDPCGECGRSAWSAGGGEEVAAPFFAREGEAMALRMQGEGVRPFAAAGGGWQDGEAPWRQAGLRWRRARGGIVSVAEASRIDEAGSVWGARFGGPGATRTETVQGRLSLSAPLDGTWRGAVGYERGLAEVSSSGGMLSGISGLRARGWSAETRGSGVFRRDDIVRLSVRRETGVSGGRAEVDHVVAAGSGFADAFWRGRPQSLERKRTAIDLAGRPSTRYALGYGLPVGEGARVAVGLEYEGESGNRAASAHLQMSF